MLRGVLRSRQAVGSQDPSTSSSAGAAPQLPPLARRRRQQPKRLRAAGGQASEVVCGAGVAHPGEEQAGSSELSAFLSTPTTALGGGGLGSSGGATLERSKLDLRREVKTTQPRTDDAGGGGNIGKSIFNGGGGGGDDDDDDDDYFDDGEGDGDGDDGFFRKVLPQLYDRVSISAVLEEWFRSFKDLPIILRRAVEMGLFSSAQLVRFCSMDVRPGLFRSVSRKLPTSMSRSFVGRLMADPAFAQKLILENVLAIGASVIYEMQMRKDRFMEELDFATINTLGLAAATSMVVWMLSPSRSYGAVKKLPWQSMLETLPNNVFDASGPLRQYTGQSRAASLLTKFAELSAVGAITGCATAGASELALAFRKKSDPEFEPSVPLPGVERSVLGMSAFVGLNAHLRYQTIGGIDRYLFDHSSFLWSYIAASTVFRVANVSVGEISRPWFQGLPSKSPLGARAPAPLGLVHAPAPRAAAAQTSDLKPKKRKAKGFELSVVSGTP